MKAAPVKTDGERLGNEFMNGVFFSACTCGFAFVNSGCREHPPRIGLMGLIRRYSSKASVNRLHAAPGFRQDASDVELFQLCESRGT